MRMARVLGVVIASSAAASTTKLTVAVPDFVSAGASKDLTATVQGLVSHELERTGIFRVVSSDMVRQLVGLERQRQLLGCAINDSSCITELAGALGAQYLIGGKVSQVKGASGSAYALELTLTNVRTASSAGSELVRASTEAGLGDGVAAAVARLVRPLASERSGTLIAHVSELGAAVKLDEVLVGTTPLSTGLSVPAGPHLLEIQKQGFVTYRREFQAVPGQTVELTSTLVPSPDFVREYEDRAGKLRLAAWISTVVAVGGVGAGAYFKLQADRLYGDASTPNSFVDLRERLNEGGSNTAALHDEARGLIQQIRNYDTLAVVGLGAGTAASLAALYFWIAGEEPGRYRTLPKPAVSVSLLPGAERFALTVGGRF